MNKTRRTQKFLIAFLILIAMVAAACGTNGEESPSADGIVIGVEAEPWCLDFVGSCAGDVGAFQMVAVQTLPRAFEVERVGEANEWQWQRTDLLAEDPVVETDPQTITYTINEDAVWDDGTAITGQDFVYTWDQIANGEDIYDRTGWQNIESVEVDENNPKVVTATFSESYAGWRSLFGGDYGILPAHILEGNDRAELMTDGYSFSGGPYKLQEWKKEDSIVLVANENYWGEKPQIEKVTFRFLEDSTAMMIAFQNNEVSAIYPQPHTQVIDEITSDNFNGEVIVNPITSNIEALWLNNAAEPFDSLAVRQALGYTLDRDAIAETVFGEIGITTAVHSFTPPILSNFATEDFNIYQPNEDRASELLEGDGWSKNDNGIYEKDGEELSFEILTLAGNQRRNIMMEDMQRQLEEAGWKTTLRSAEGPDFGPAFGGGEYQAVLVAKVQTSLEPQNCSSFCSENIPTDENDFAGLNYTATNISELDTLLRQVEVELDEEARIQANKDAEIIMANEAISYPLSSLPNIFIWKSNINGPVDENPILGPFYNLASWSL